MNNRLRQAEATIRQKKVNPDKVLTLLKPLAKKKNAPWKVYHISGIASFLKKQFGKAEEFFIRALEAGSPNAETFCYAGRCCHVRNDHEKAAGYLKRAVGINRDYYAAWMYLGDVHKDTGKLNEALQCYGQCNRIDSSKAEVAMKIGGIYRDQAFSDKALEMFDIVLKMEPENISALNEKAKIYKDRQDHETAMGVIRSALEIAPQEANLLAMQAEIHKESGDFLEALRIYEEILEQHPNYGGLRVNYANILQDLGRFDEAEKNYLRANQDTPSLQETFSNYLFVQHYNPEKSKEEMLDALKKWDAIYAPESPERPVPEDRDKEKKLRIGLVSGGFRKHPVGLMIVAGLENLDQEKYDLYFYSNHNQVDDVTKRLHKTAAEWRMISGFSDQKVNEMIREDEIDILVELSGHAAESRLRAVAMGPAPVIVKWVGGLINTTGLKAIDYLITDWIETPEGSDSDYLEKLVRMPDDYICFTPPADSPEVKESPFRENGFITFGCFNNPIKVNPVLLEKWAGLMKQVPDSRLFLKSKQYGNEFYTRRIEALMQEFGIGKERLIFEGYSPHHELLKAYNRVDIALDPWPYSGGLTTCEALWMGVPVITCPGPTFAGRHAATHIQNAGFPEWVAESWEEYVEKVSDLASDREKLAELRVGLRDNVAASPLCDGARFGAALGSAFRSMWVAYAEGRLKEDAIAVMIPEGDLTVGSLEEKEESVVEITGEEVPAESEAPSERAEAESVEIAQVEEQSEVPEKQQATSEGIDSTKESHEEYGDEPAVMASEKSLQSPAVGESTAAQSDESSSTANSDEEIEKIARFPWERGVKDNLLVHGNHNIVYSVPDSVEIMSTYVLLEQGQWYDGEVGFVMEYLQPGMQVLDVGAGFGAYALGAAKKVGSTGKVFAFEPVDIMRKHLAISMVENGITNLEVSGRALGSTNGKMGLSESATPELTVLESDGNEVQVVTFDSWWDFEGNPELDVIKIDVNGHEPDVLKGAERCITKTSPVFVIAASEAGPALGDVVDYLGSKGYTFFDFISGVGVLSPVEDWSRRDAYAQNVIAVKEKQVSELKTSGWVHDESIEVNEPEVGIWKKTLKSMPWTESLFAEWEKATMVPANKNYFRALDYICAAEAMSISIDDDEESGDAQNSSITDRASISQNGKSADSKAIKFRKDRSKKAKLLLIAAQELISKYHAGDGGASAAYTLVRVLNTLGKRDQAVVIMQKLMKDTKMGQENLDVNLPFLLPIPSMDNAPIRTDFNKWLMVRTIESWLQLKDLSGYLSAPTENKLREVLHGNPEGLSEKKVVVQDKKNENSYKKNKNDYVCIGKDSELANGEYRYMKQNGKDDFIRCEKTLKIPKEYRPSKKTLNIALTNYLGPGDYDIKNIKFYPVKGAALGMSTACIYRIQVINSCNLSVNFIVKILRKDNVVNKSAIDYWERELLFYRVNNIISSKLKVPKLLSEQDNGKEYMILLEYIEDDNRPWTKDDYKNAVKCIANFNKLTINTEPYEWLAKGQINYLDTALRMGVYSVELLEKLGHSDISTNEIKKIFQKLLTIASPLLGKLHSLQLPTVVCHSDLHKNNLLRNDGRIIALDWATVSRSFPGEDLGRLVHPFYAGDSNWPDIDKLAEWFEYSLEHYLLEWDSCCENIKNNDIEYIARLSNITRVSYTLYRIKNSLKNKKYIPEDILLNISNSLELYAYNGEKILDKNACKSF